jgi:hypothetical protein
MYRYYSILEVNIIDRKSSRTTSTRTIGGDMGVSELNIPISDNEFNPPIVIVVTENIKYKSLCPNCIRMIPLLHFCLRINDP